jgi:hypothetical protein
MNQSHRQLDHVYQKPVVGPASELHPAVLIVVGEVFNVDLNILHRFIVLPQKNLNKHCKVI